MSQLCYSDLEAKVLKDSCAETSRSLKNINSGNEVTCYEFNPIYFKDRDLDDLRKPVKDNIEKKTKGIAGYEEQFQRIFDVATSSTTLFAIDTTMPPKRRGES